MDHNVCTKALAEYNAGPLSKRMVPAFLYNRTMSVKINDSYSQNRPIRGSSPQGCLLGNFLFCLTTDCCARLGEAEIVSDPLVDPNPDNSAPWSPPRAEESPVGLDSGDDDEVVHRRPRRRMLWDSSDEEDEECAIPSQYQLNSFFQMPVS